MNEQQIKAMELALEALETHVPYVYKDRGYAPITAIKEALAQPEQEPVECDCNQGQSCHVCDPYFPFDSAPQTTRLTQKTTTNDVAIGVDVTEDGTHVTAMRMRPDGINIVIYSQFHPLAQPEQHQDWCASLTQLLMSMPPKPAPCNCKPPQRTWVGLTDEERMGYMLGFGINNEVVRSIEAKLKEKNT